jgi:hypothetical protein
MDKDSGSQLDVPFSDHDVDGMMATPVHTLADVPCVRCGYNLRSLHPEQSCPECGLGIARSLALGQALRDSRPGWIASLAWAARLLLLAHLVALFGLVMPELIRSFLSGWYVTEVIRGTILVLAAALHCIGCWLLTRPENPYTAAKPHRYLAVSLRLCSLGPLVSAGMGLAAALLNWLWYQDYSFAPPPNWLRNTYGFLNSYGMYPLFLFVPCPLLQFVLLRRLAVRVLDRHLFEQITIVGCGLPVSILLLFFCPSCNLNCFIGYYVVLLIWVAFLLFWLWSLYVFTLSAHAFFAAARQARVTWQHADSARSMGNLPHRDGEMVSEP